jgi:hypothetical protein
MVSRACKSRGAIWWWMAFGSRARSLPRMLSQIAFIVPLAYPSAKMSGW